MKTLLLALGLVVAPGSAPEGARGVVVDAAGKPVAGALVVLIGYHDTDKKESDYVTRTDNQGRFAFPRCRDDDNSWTVLAYKAGLALGGVQRPPRAVWRAGAEMSPHDLKVRLLQPSRICVRLLGPDGKAPGDQARVALTDFGTTRRGGADGNARFLDFYTAVPALLAEHVHLALDRDGKMVLDNLAPYSSVTLEFNSPRFGKQVAEYVSLKPEGEQIIQLQPVGILSGQVVADDPQAVCGLKINVSTRRAPAEVQRPGDHVVLGTVGQAVATTDEKGHFKIEDLAAGEATISVDVPKERPWLLEENKTTTKVMPAASTEVKVKLARCVSFHGRFVDKSSGQGVPGVIIGFPHSGVRSVTDAQGEFRAYVLPGRVSYSYSVPLPWLVPMNTYHGVDVPARSASFELAPIKLTRAVPLTGAVVDEQGQPAARGRVSAVWLKAEGLASTIGSETAYTGSDGRFVLRRVPADVELALTAQTEQRATAESTRVPPRQREPVRLTVRPDAMVVFEGRVVDQNGKPVKDAWLQFRKTIQVPGQKWVYGQTALSFGEDPVRSDADGRYRTPHGVPRNDSYALVAGASGMVSYESKYITPPRDGKPFRWPDVVLRHQNSVAGVVVDHEGKPVPGAAVFSHGVDGTQGKSQTDASGKFTLANLHPDARLVFVQKDGYRASGDQIRHGRDLRITLEAENAPPSVPLRSLRRPRKERTKLLKDLVTPLLARADDQDNDYLVPEALTRLAPLARTFVLRNLDRLRSNTRRVGVLVALGSLDDALEQAALVKDAYSRALQHLAIADASRDAARKRAILAEALLDARAIEMPDHCVYMLAEVAGHLLKLGDRAAAQRILDDARGSAAQLAPVDWSAFARGHCGECLAPLDPEAALDLIKPLKGDDLVRHAGNIAHQLAAVRPADAERALALAKDERYVTSYAVRVCYRMAPVDLPRARRLADAINRPNDPLRTAANKAQAYGAMAVALAPQDPPAAQALLREAFQFLDSSGHHNWYEWQIVGGVAVTLVGYSETVDPPRTRAYFWRTLALHPGPQIQSWSQNRDKEAHENTAQLVLLLALYGQYPELQKELMEPVFRYWSNYTNRQDYNFYRENAVFTAMALADPQRTIAWHTAFYPTLSKDDRRLYPQPWMTIADVLKSDGPALHEQITGQVYHLWVIDKEDL